MGALSKYKEMTKELEELDKKELEDEANALRDKMDIVWWVMTEEERKQWTK